MISLKSTLFAAVLASIYNFQQSSNTYLIVNAAPLPSNALNRWSKTFVVRGGESTTTIAEPIVTLVSTKTTKVSMDDNAMNKMKKKRKKKSTNIPGGKAPAVSLLPMSKQQSIAASTADASLSPSEERSSQASESTKSDDDKMPSIFQAEESLYDKYAACLAATEGLRRIRDSKLKNKKFRTAVNVDAERKSGWKSLLKSQSHQNQSDSKTKENGGKVKSVAEQNKEEYKRACAEYVLNSSKAIKALGLSVSQFNQLGREIKKDKFLKEKVMEQAYLYRMASTVHLDKIPIIEDPNAKQLLKSQKRRRVQMFVKSISEIEDLRSDQMDRLKRALNIDKLPDNVNLCDPNVLPLLNSKVRAVIEAFPLQAEVIVKKYGLNSDEFNQMLEESRGNPVFRWRIQRYKDQDDNSKHKKKSNTTTKKRHRTL